jgi:hypothetical protein
MRDWALAVEWQASVRTMKLAAAVKLRMAFSMTTA